MKIISEKNTLVKILSRIQGIVEKNSISPITSNALISADSEGLCVSATDLQIGMTAKYSEVKVERPGTVSVNARKIFEIIRQMPKGDVCLEEKDNYRIDITAGKDVLFNIIGLPPEDFPMPAKQEEGEFLNWESEKIQRMFHLTSFSMSRDETKLNICGAFFERLEGDIARIVTTDGYRLSIADDHFEENIDQDQSFIIPCKAVGEMNRILGEKKESEKCSILVSDKNLLVRIGEVDLFIRLLEKKFPDYKIIVPGEGEERVEAVIEKDVIRQTLKRTSVISQENNKPVVFSFRQKHLEIFTEDSDLGSVKETIELKEPASQEFSFCINGQYMMDIINAVDDDIVVEYNSKEKNKPIVVKPLKDRQRIKYIIMPMAME